MTIIEAFPEKNVQAPGPGAGNPHGTRAVLLPGDETAYRLSLSQGVSSQDKAAHRRPSRGTTRHRERRVVVPRKRAPEN
ncbi:hypothetical protein, partial [uncultured Salinisphaera sp.]|uniref:hypothetical protein n=1 Tax=uncultured Salinisphaera sp. TaxID=359372 RepID=UPI0032B26EA5